MFYCDEFMSGMDSLFSEDWYSRCYGTLARLIRNNTLPSLAGQPTEINTFINNIILNQRGRDWIRLFGFLLDELAIGAISAKKINMMIRSRPMDTNARPEIVQSHGLGHALLELERNPVTFTGTTEEAVEFTLRFLLSQITGQWPEALGAILRRTSGKKQIRLVELNKILEVWDYTRLFARR